MRPTIEDMKTWWAGKGPEEIGRKVPRETERRSQAEFSLFGFAQWPSLSRGSIRECDACVAEARFPVDPRQTQSKQLGTRGARPSRSNHHA